MLSLILVALSALQATPVQKPRSPFTVSSMQQRVLTPSSIEPARQQYILGPPPPAGCAVRIVDGDLPFDLPRIPPQTYQDVAPLSSIRVDFCVVLDRTIGFENFSTLGAGNFTVTPRFIQFDASISSTHAPGFSLGTVDIVLPPLAFMLSVFDGVFDLGGISGVLNTDHQAVLGVAHLTVDPNDPVAQAFFRSPFTVYLSAADMQPWTIHGNGNFYEQETTNGSCGLFMAWNQ